MGGALSTFSLFSSGCCPECPSQLELFWPEIDESGLQRFGHALFKCSQSLESAFSRRKVDKKDLLWVVFFTWSGTMRWHGSGDLHILDTHILNKSLIKKKCALKSMASPYGSREFNESYMYSIWRFFSVGIHAINKAYVITTDLGIFLSSCMNIFGHQLVFASCCCTHSKDTG